MEGGRECRAAIYDEDTREESGEFVERGSIGILFEADASISTYGPANNLCMDEYFYHEKTLEGSFCTGFLVGQQILLTAGHCAMRSDFCDNVRIAFGVNVMPEDTKELETFRCDHVLSKKISMEEDYALVLLDRPVSGAVPFELANYHSAVGSQVAMYSHPLGLTTKISFGEILSRNSGYYATNLDGFKRSSGAPVVDLLEGKVIGIYTRGRQDFSYDSDRGCYIHIKYPGASGAEVVTDIGSVAQLLSMYAF